MVLSGWNLLNIHQPLIRQVKPSTKGSKRVGDRDPRSDEGGGRDTFLSPSAPFKSLFRIAFDDIHEGIFEAVLAGGLDGGPKALGLELVPLWLHLDGQDVLFLARLLLSTFPAC